MIQFLNNLALFLVKNANFFHINIFKNPNVGPSSQCYDLRIHSYVQRRRCSRLDLFASIKNFFLL
jgi:hypothetical protein